LHALGADAIADLLRPFELVGLVTRVPLHRVRIVARVEHLEAEIDLLLLRESDHLLDAVHRVPDAGLIVELAAHSRERDDPAETGRGRRLDAFAENLKAARMIRGIVEPFLEPVARGDRADEPV